ncbi:MULTISPECIES: DUF5130 family protein [unclassified Nocardioides]|uniref:DUF5130 family protein n=1 Tax=unclassified Nocardioides TaxID=2615069 RepID=UPI002666F179|nr:DUF5130 family protein [Nocardioides sp. Arc9.136]WKN49758.1 DUF5130 family protein [Nocardioides sp. Arc9.136]
MPAGEPLTPAQRTRLDEAIRAAERHSRVEFSVFIGHAEGPARPFATQLHNSLVAPARSILVMVDPGARTLEIVTGGWVRRSLTDKEVELVALHMQQAFAEDDLVGGLVRGIQMLADHARSPQTLHAPEA